MDCYDAPLVRCAIRAALTYDLEPIDADKIDKMLIVELLVSAFFEGVEYAKNHP